MLKKLFKKNSKNYDEPFGPHLMVELYNCSPESLNDHNLVYQILDELPDAIGMHKMTKPYVVYTEGNEIRDPGGWSGFVIIQESHISLHTFIKKRFVTADVYSCKEFDTKKALDYFKRRFKTEDIEYNILTRGSRFPKDNIDL